MDLTNGYTDTKEIFDQVVEILDNGGHLIFTDKILVPRKRLTGLLYQLRQAIPDEVERAAEILMQRKNILDKAKSDADVIVLEAKAKAEDMQKNAEQERERLIQMEPALCNMEDEIAAMKRSVAEECGRIRVDALNFATQVREDIDKYREDVLASSCQYIGWVEGSLRDCLSSVRTNSLNIANELAHLRKTEK